MTYEELKAKTKDMAEAASLASEDGKEGVGFVLLTVTNANDGEGHYLFGATNLDRDTVRYIASMADEVVGQILHDAIGSTVGTA